jgi:hypothetical protein
MLHSLQVCLFLAEASTSLESAWAAAEHVASQGIIESGGFEDLTTFVPEAVIAVDKTKATIIRAAHLPTSALALFDRSAHAVHSTPGRALTMLTLKSSREKAPANTSSRRAEATRLAITSDALASRSALADLTAYKKPPFNRPPHYGDFRRRKLRRVRCPPCAKMSVRAPSALGYAASDDAPHAWIRRRR